MVYLIFANTNRQSLFVRACFDLGNENIFSNILKFQELFPLLINCAHVKFRRTQFQPGRNGDPGTMGLAVVSVDLFAG